MPTPTSRQSRNHHAEQAAIAAAASAAVGQMLRRRLPWAETLTALAQYQLAAATWAVRTVAGWSEGGGEPLVNPRPFAGISSGGFPVAEPLVAAMDRVVAAPVEPLPPPWWDETHPEVEAMIEAAMRVVEGQVKDASRAAEQTEIVAQPEWQNYVRMLVPPSCPRCTILAGRVYRDLDAFSRHEPTCDCRMVPVQDWEEAHDAGLVSSPAEAFEKGQVRGLSEADARAIAEGADMAQVVNAAQGMTTAEVFGRRVKATTAGTTKRAVWRRANPTRLVRLRPESIFRIVDAEYGGDREEARRLLALYGYLLP